MFKLERKIKMNARGQSMLDYALLFGIVAIILFSMAPYMRRSIQGMVRTVSDQIGTQQGAEQSANRDRGDGFLISSSVAAQTKSDKGTDEYLESWNYSGLDQVSTQIETITNLGFIERNGR